MSYHHNDSTDKNPWIVVTKTSVKYCCSLAMMLSVGAIAPTFACGDIIDVDYFGSAASEAYGSPQSSSQEYESPRRRSSESSSKPSQVTMKESSASKKKSEKTESETQTEYVKKTADSSSTDKKAETSSTEKKTDAVAVVLKDKKTTKDSTPEPENSKKQTASESNKNQSEKNNSRATTDSKDSKGSDSLKSNSKEETKHGVKSKLAQAENVVSNIGSTGKKGLKSIISVPKKIFGKAMSFRPSGQTETGIASYYGHPWHGRRTASGEIYDMYSMTAAHKTLPFGTHVRVTNLRNGRNCIVRINNRGPYSRGRIIDLSHAAASQLGMMGAGISRVKLDILRRHD